MNRRTKVRAAYNGRLNSTKAKWNAKYARRDAMSMLKHTGVRIIVCGTAIWVVVEYYVSYM